MGRPFHVKLRRRKTDRNLSRCRSSWRGSPTLHAKAPANPNSSQGVHPNNWRATDPRTGVTWKVRLSFRVGAGITFQLRCGRDVGPHLQTLLVVLGCACWWLSLVWLGAGASGGCWCFSLACGFLVVSFSFLRARRPEDRSEGVGFKEGVPASQSALLLGPERSFRFVQPFHVML